MRRDVLRAEREIRRLVADGARGIADRPLGASGAGPRRRGRTHLKVDGELADCDHELAAALWSATPGRASSARRRGASMPTSTGSCRRCPTSSVPPSSTPRPGAGPRACRLRSARLHQRPVRFRDDVAPARQGSAEGRAAARPARADRVGARGAEAAAVLRARSGDRARAIARAAVRVSLRQLRGCCRRVPGAAPRTWSSS